MSKRSFRIALVVVVSSLLLVGAVGAFLIKQALAYPTVRRHGAGQEIAVQIEPGMSFPAIAELLHRKGVIDRPRWFRLYGMHRGATTKVKVGEYVLRDDLTPEEVLDHLLEGVKDVTAQVTVPEGLNMLEVFALVEQAGVAKAAELEKLARDPAFVARQGLTGETVEGYLFPETYRFKVPSKPELVLATMIKQHRIVWDRLRREHGAAVKKLEDKLGWSDREVVIMASIVEKEAVIDVERPRIAQVFINRLTSSSFTPHRLDTDPTIRYGCTVPLAKTEPCKAWDKAGRLHRAQLDDAGNLYNTYQHDGLPPGPISNPGERSLNAALKPDGSDYFFFVAKDDHSHIFAKTRAEHERNVDKYVRGQ